MLAQAEVDFIEKRRFKRVPLPTGTSALFKNEQKIMDSGYVCDISESGILISEYFPGVRYNVGSKVYDIFITIPENRRNSALIKNQKIPLIINEGIIVRAFEGDTPNTSCYGISFEYDSPSVREKLMGYVNNTDGPHI